jgi:hypothetical protein
VGPAALGRAERRESDVLDISGSDPSSVPEPNPLHVAVARTVIASVAVAVSNPVRAWTEPVIAIAVAFGVRQHHCDPGPGLGELSGSSADATGSLRVASRYRDLLPMLATPRTPRNRRQRP